jgi:PAS domain S-box-containing protein
VPASDQSHGEPSELARLRHRCAELEAALELLRSEPAAHRRDLENLAAQLDALVRSSSEVRYQLNANWSELAHLQGGGFIPDTAAGNRNWLEDYIPEEHRELVREEIKRAIEARDTYNIEHKVNRVDGSVGWALSRAVPLIDDKGEVSRWIGSASDITERKTAEDAQRVLNLELAHRMKNTLAMVQAIVAQTLRQAKSIEAGQALIAARLNALACAQDILTQKNFTQADIKEVVVEALRPHRTGQHRIEIEGPRFMLTPQRVLGLSLAIHELATNAMKYGSLSNETGRVVVFWAVADDVFTFSWREGGGPPVVEPESRGFGSKLIERVVAAYFGGQGQIEFHPNGIHFTLTGRSVDRTSNTSVAE